MGPEATLAIQITCLVIFVTIILTLVVKVGMEM